MKIHLTPSNAKSLQIDCHNGEATEIVIEDLLDRVPPAEVYNTLSGWVAKMAHGASLTIVGTDFDEVAHARLNGMGMEEVNRLMSGRTLLTMNDVVQMLLSHNVKIIRKRVSGPNFIVECVRP